MLFLYRQGDHDNELKGSRETSGYICLPSREPPSKHAIYRLGYARSSPQANRYISAGALSSPVGNLIDFAKLKW